MVIEKYLRKNNELAINIVETQINSIKRSNTSQTGLRVYENGLIGVSGAIGGYDLYKLKNRAIETLKLKIPYEYTPTKNIMQELVYEKCIDLNENTIIEELADLLYMFREKLPKFVFFNKAKIIDKEEKYENSQNVHMLYTNSFIDLYIGFKKENSCTFFDGGFGYVGNKFDKITLFRMFQKIIYAFDNYIQLPSSNMKYPVIFFTEDRTPFRKLIDGLNGFAYGTKSSILSDKLEKKVFSSKFSFSQTASPEKSFNAFFDAEGTVNKDYEYTLIDKGILLSPYTDKRASKDFNLPLTGSAVSDFDGVPTTGLTGFTVKDSGKTIKQLLGGKPGILVFVANGGDFLDNGDLRLPVQFALFYDGVNLIGRVPPILISTNLFDMFGSSFVGVGRDEFFPLAHEKCMVMELDVSLLKSGTN